MKTKHRKARAVTKWATVDKDGSIDYCNIQDRRSDLYWDPEGGERAARVRIVEAVKP